jgi:hypothetical protein
VATIRRGSEAALVGPADWPALLASDDAIPAFEFDTIEVVSRNGARPLSDVRTIRISDHDHRHLADEYARAIVGAGPRTDRTSAYGALLQLVDDGTLILEVVP